MKSTPADYMEGAAHQLLGLTTDLRQALHLAHAVDHGVKAELPEHLDDAARRFVNAWNEAGSPCGDTGYVVVLEEIDGRVGS